MQRHQSLAWSFARAGFEVVYLDPPGTCGFGVSVTRLCLGMTVAEVTVPFRSACWPSLQKLANRMAFSLLDKKLSLKPEEAIFWTGDPVVASISSKNWAYRVYDRSDLHGSFPGQNPSPWRQLERILFDNCDLIVATSEPLMNFEGGCRRLLVPNAVDPRWKQDTSRHRRSVPPLHVVCAGAMYEWIDFEWLQAFAGRSELVLHIAGSGRGRLYDRLISTSGVVNHSILSHEQLRILLDKCHVGVIPFVDSSLTEAADPVKAYEYAARGLVIWAPSGKGSAKNQLVTRIIPLPELKIADLNSLFQADSATLPPQKQIPDWQQRASPLQEILSRL